MSSKVPTTLGKGLYLASTVLAGGIVAFAVAMVMVLGPFGLMYLIPAVVVAIPLVTLGSIARQFIVRTAPDRTPNVE